MTVPNILSIIRLFITLFFILAVNQGRFRLALALFILQALTDLLDGFLARAMNAKTRLGAFLDPLADKTMLLAAFIVLGIKGIVPFWIVGLVVVRDIVLVLGFILLYLFTVTERPHPSIWGKIATTLQILAIVWLLWSDSRVYDLYFLYPMAFFTLLSGALYTVRGLQVLSRKFAA
jgi:cardiolipin synthase (CMP-forming)